jgi:hypothetical protein
VADAFGRLPGDTGGEIEMMATAMRTGKVMIRAAFGPIPGKCGNGWQYRAVFVQQEADGSLYYYHGAGTCNTSDGMVTLPAEYASEVVWDN